MYNYFSFFILALILYAIKHKTKATLGHELMIYMEGERTNRY